MPPLRHAAMPLLLPLPARYAALRHAAMLAARFIRCRCCLMFTPMMLLLLDFADADSLRYFCAPLRDRCCRLPREAAAAAITPYAMLAA